MVPVVLLAGVLGCDGNGNTQPPVDTDSGVTDTDPPGPDRTDEGSVVVLSSQPSVVDDQPHTVLFGMFVETAHGVVNLAECVGAAGGFCTEGLPVNPGDSVVVTDLDPAFLGSLASRDVGSEIRLGPWVGAYGFDSASGLGFYYGTVSDAVVPSGPMGLTLSGVWGPYSGTNDVIAPTPIEVTNPDPMRAAEFSDAAPVFLEWTPGADGSVFLLLDTPNERSLTLLDDDGSESVDLSPFGLTDGDVVDITLGRWGLGEVDHDGHTVSIEVQSNQVIHGTFRTIGPRDEFSSLYDECADARVAPSAVPGNYYGDLSPMTKDLNPGTGGCTGFQAKGIDGVVPIDLAPDDLLTVNYQLVSDDASLYLLVDCDDVGTCIAGSDNSLNSGVEQIVFLNSSGSNQRVYAILDAFDTVTDRFNLDIYIDSLGGDILVPTCVEAIDQGPVTTGSFHGTIAGNADLLDPDCAAPAGGGEGILQVYLDAGQTLHATVTAPGGDPKMYLLYNCSIADSCFATAVGTQGNTEDLMYTNNTGFSEFLYLVVDGELNLGEYVLDLTIQ